jgi:hypothetical protein
MVNPIKNKNQNGLENVVQDGQWSGIVVVIQAQTQTMTILAKRLETGFVVQQYKDVMVWMLMQLVHLQDKIVLVYIQIVKVGRHALG